MFETLTDGGFQVNVHNKIKIYCFYLCLFQIIDAYFYLLQERSNGTVLTVTSMFKFLKNPVFPKGSNYSSVEFVFIPLRISGHWCLIVS